MFKREKLKEFMIAKGLSNCELARQIGVTEKCIRNYLSGIKQPSLATASEIAALMGCSLDELVEKEAV